VGDHDSLLTQGIVDSMGALELVGFIESEFDLTVTDDELLSDHFETIASMAEMVDRKLNVEESTWIS
jgi:acyl carrier protein